MIMMGLLIAILSILKLIVMDRTFVREALVVGVNNYPFLKKENDQKTCQFALRQQLKTNDQGKSYI